jgi:hypothetical protein
VDVCIPLQRSSIDSAIEEDPEQMNGIDVTSADVTFARCIWSNHRGKSIRSIFYKNDRIEMKDLINTRVRTIVRKELLSNAVSFASDSLLQHRMCMKLM